jgi:hypothetical protein
LVELAARLAREKRENKRPKKVNRNDEGLTVILHAGIDPSTPKFARFIQNPAT